MRPIGKINEYAAAAMAVARPIVSHIAKTVAVKKGTELAEKGVDATVKKLKRKPSVPPVVNNDREVS